MTKAQKSLWVILNQKSLENFENENPMQKYVRNKFSKYERIDTLFLKTVIENRELFLKCLTGNDEDEGPITCIQSKYKYTKYTKYTLYEVYKIYKVYK